MFVELADMHCVKNVRIRSYSGPHFPAFGRNTERYGVTLRIHSKCGKMRTRITPNTDTFYTVIWKSYAYTYCTKTALKVMWLKRTTTQTNFKITSTKFFNGILSSILKVISPTWDSIFLLEKAKYFCRKNVSTEEFWHGFKGCHLGCLLLLVYTYHVI